MPPPPIDADVERLVRRSGAFRAVRAALLAVDAAFASSVIARLLPRRPSRQSLGILLLTASASHAILEALLPGTSAPAGRYLFAAGGAAVAALLLAVPRSQ